jgi:cytoskeletal protein RodZ
MSFLQNIFRSKLNILTFVIFPVVIVMLIIIWIFLSYSSSKSALETTPTQSSQQSISIALDQSLNSIIISNSSKKDTTKASFDDLDKSKSADKPTSSSAIALTSPVASTPELDAKEIYELLDKVDQVENNDDVALDNQILEN